MTKRMIANSAAAAAGKAVTIYGRTYTAAAGTTYDAPDQDAAVLEANGFLSTGGPTCIGVGTTALRPTTGLFIGASYVDTTLAYVVVYDGALWRNPSSGASV